MALKSPRHQPVEVTDLGDAVGPEFSRVDFTSADAQDRQIRIMEVDLIPCR
jgi:hypothetical protein